MYICMSIVPEKSSTFRILKGCMLDDKRAFEFNYFPATTFFKVSKFKQCIVSCFIDIYLASQYTNLLYYNKTIGKVEHIFDHLIKLILLLKLLWSTVSMTQG